MLNIKEKGRRDLVFIRNNHPDYIGGYSVIVQNTVTKEVTIYNVEDTGNTMYIKFNIDIQLENGEYYVLLFENPSHLPFYSDMNDIKDITYIKYITKDGEYLKSGKFFIVYGISEERIHPLSVDMMKVGEYIHPSTQYKKQQGFIQYNK